MIKRLMPLILVTMCALPLAAPAQVATGAPAGDAQVRVAEATAMDVVPLTAADREALQLAQLSSDTQLGDLRGGNVGVLVVLLLIILIIVLVD
jgi:hypothetical protein